MMRRNNRPYEMSSNSIGRLLRGQASGVYRLRGALPHARLAALADPRRLRVYEVHWAGAGGKHALMAALAAGLDLPDYFRANWDELADCLMDFGWAPARGYVLRLRGLGAWAGRMPREYAILLDVMAEAARTWAAGGTAFYVLLEDPGPVTREALPQAAAG